MIYEVHYSNGTKTVSTSMEEIIASVVDFRVEANVTVWKNSNALLTFVIKPPAV